jgi:hypothetical protein
MQSPQTMKDYLETLTAQERKKVIKAIIASMYQAVSDPIFFKWQAGEASKEDWLAARSLVDSFDDRLVTEYTISKDVLELLKGEIVDTPAENLDTPAE